MVADAWMANDARRRQRVGLHPNAAQDFMLAAPEMAGAANMRGQVSGPKVTATYSKLAK